MFEMSHDAGAERDRAPSGPPIVPDPPDMPALESDSEDDVADFSVALPRHMEQIATLRTLVDELGVPSRFKSNVRRMEALGYRFNASMKRFVLKTINKRAIVAVQRAKALVIQKNMSAQTASAELHAYAYMVHHPDCVGDDFDMLHDATNIILNLITPTEKTCAPNIVHLPLFQTVSGETLENVHAEPSPLLGTIALSTPTIFQNVIYSFFVRNKTEKTALPSINTSVGEFPPMYVCLALGNVEAATTLMAAGFPIDPTTHRHPRFREALDGVTLMKLAEIDDRHAREAAQRRAAAGPSKRRPDPEPSRSALLHVPVVSAAEIRGVETRVAAPPPPAPTPPKSYVTMDGEPIPCAVCHASVSADNFLDTTCSVCARRIACAPSCVRSIAHALGVKKITYASGMPCLLTKTCTGTLQAAALTTDGTRHVKFEPIPVVAAPPAVTPIAPPPKEPRPETGDPPQQSRKQQKRAERRARLRKEADARRRADNPEEPKRRPKPAHPTPQPDGVVRDDSELALLSAKPPPDPAPRLPKKEALAPLPSMRVYRIVDGKRVEVR